MTVLSNGKTVQSWRKKHSKCQKFRFLRENANICSSYIFLGPRGGPNSFWWQRWSRLKILSVLIFSNVPKPSSSHHPWAILVPPIGDGSPQHPSKLFWCSVTVGDIVVRLFRYLVVNNFRPDNRSLLFFVMLNKEPFNTSEFYFTFGFECFITIENRPIDF